MCVRVHTISISVIADFSAFALVTVHVCIHAHAQTHSCVQDLDHLQALSLDNCNLRGRSIHKLFTVFVCTTSLTSLSLAQNEVSF
jgi:hypothetical protein